MTARVVIGLLAAFRAVLIYGEASVAETWQPRWPLPRARTKSLARGSAVARI